MARTSLTAIAQDPIDDGGSILWSFIKGEQLEYPVTLEFLTNALAGYTCEAVVVEADNVTGQTSAPTSHKVGGVQTVLNVRVPTLRGNWDAPSAYNREEVVAYNGKYYKLILGTAYVSATTPDVDTLHWAETGVNVVYLQFPKTLAATYSVQPIVGSPTYGFFELRVTEPDNGIFQRTWKPMRGLVEILFSPTDVVPDP